MAEKATSKRPGDRITVTLATGQRQKLELLANRNNVKLAFVVRHAIQGFLERAGDRQLVLDFTLPPDAALGDQHDQ